MGHKVGRLVGVAPEVASYGDLQFTLSPPCAVATQGVAKSHPVSSTENVGQTNLKE